MASATALPVDSTVDDCYTAYDHPELASRYVRKKDTEAATGGSTSQVVIQLENLQCAGCCSTVEKALAKLPGVIGAEVNYTTHQLRVGWNLQQTELSTILRILGKLGYPGQPLGVDTRGDLLARQRSSLLKRFGVAAAFGMQIMVLSVCLYTGQWWGIEPELADLFRYLSLLLVIPILVYSARPFFVAAVRSLFSGRIGMDVPVSLGLTVAFLASLYSLGTGGLEIYFDSIAMFVFLVLGSRLIESGHRLRAVNAVAVYDAVLPVSALKKFKQDQWRHVPAMSLEPGDQVAVDSGEVVPADGVILTGRSSFDESLLTGESLPLVKAAGESVVAGAANVEHPVVIEVTQSGDQTMVSALARLVQKASFEKPRTSLLVEKLAGWFVLTVLTIALITAGAGYAMGSPIWLSSTIAVLIVSCPCALALATPAALSVAMGQAKKMGVLVTNATALEQFARVDHIFLDKTGTLTTGLFEVLSVEMPGQIGPDKHCKQEAVFQIVSALESFSRHPVAVALRKYIDDHKNIENPEIRPGLSISDIKSVAGGGISGTVNGKSYFLGTPDFIRVSTAHAFTVPETQDGTVAVLADENGVVAIFTLRDQLREGAASLIRTLKSSHRHITVLSGDQQAPVEQAAKILGITDYHANCTPEKKLEIVSNNATKGEVTAMLGDGVNDAAVISRAEVSVAVGDNVNLTSISADMILLNSNLEAIAATLGLSARLRTIIRQNLGWALGYNLIAIPFAAVGMVPPWLAAIGMSLSSLLVVLNATRLSRGANRAWSTA